MPAGRPPQPVPQDLADHIVERVGNGVPLAQVVRENPRLPTLAAVYDWLAKDKDFSIRFARARAAGYDHIANDLLAIADEQPPTNDKGSSDAGYVAWQKNRIWTRLQLLAKWDPKRYGERIEVAGDPEAPLEVIDRNERDTARRIALALALGLKAPREQAIEGESTPVFEPIAHSAQDDIDDLI